MANGKERMADSGYSSSGLSHPTSKRSNAISAYKDFEAMEVWRDAQDLAVSVYRDFSKVTDYSFCDQIKRAAVSISNNVALRPVGA